MLPKVHGAGARGSEPGGPRISTNVGAMRRAVPRLRWIMPIRHTVKDGECIHSIAAQYGFFPETIWNHADNADLKASRRDAAVLQPGDVVVVPDLRPRTESRSTDARHRFRRKGVPARLRVQLMVGGEPCANARYVLDIDGELSEGTTDDEGNVQIPIPPGAQRGKITIEGEEYEFTLGTLDPVTDERGVVQRLGNLGFLDDEAEGDEGAYAEALKRFQAFAGLKQTGKADQATREKLVELHGS